MRIVTQRFALRAMLASAALAVGATGPALADTVAAAAAGSPRVTPAAASSLRGQVVGQPSRPPSGIVAAAAATAASPRPVRIITEQDLANLDKSKAAFNVAEVPLAGISPAAPLAPSPGVTLRYAELIAEANIELARLEREKLAGSNPYLRGLSAGRVPRAPSEIDAHLQQWRDRKAMAEDQIERARQAGATLPGE